MSRKFPKKKVDLKFEIKDGGVKFKIRLETVKKILLAVSLLTLLILIVLTLINPDIWFDILKSFMNMTDLLLIALQKIHIAPKK